MALTDGGLHRHAPLIVCNQGHRFLMHEQCMAIGHTPITIYLGLADRNTAPAIAMDNHVPVPRRNSDPDARMFVLPSDRVITNQAAFHLAFA
jgi:mannose-1-phosphate guanylyltransferase